MNADRRGLLSMWAGIACVMWAGVTCGPGNAAEDAPSTSVAADESPITPSDREHWAFRPLVRPDVPTIQDGADADWPRNAIDRFILDRLLRAGLQPSPAADHRTLLRRITFDLTGLPPTPAEIDAFVSDDQPDAIGRVADRLLASSAYGERWAQHWLDLARFADTDGYEHDKVRPDAWRYRDWVIDALNHDVPFDDFVRFQLAGDEIDRDLRVATGFLTCGPDMPDINLQDERRHSFLNGVTSTVGSVFLGLQLGCAQCHDHKYDPISQLDFYRLRAFFDGAFKFERDRPLDLPKGNQSGVASRVMIRGDFRRPGLKVQPAFVRIADTRGELPLIAADHSNTRRVLSDWLTRSDNALVLRTQANRLWQRHMGEGFSSTPADFGLTGDSPLQEDLLNWLATEIPRQGWSLKRIHRLIVTSATYAQASRLSDDATADEIQQWQDRLHRDSLNRLHSRGQRQRLEGEAIRDALLASSGLLTQRRRGEGVRPPLPDDLVKTLLKNQWPVSPDKADHHRRSIYLFVRRNLRDPLFDVFDKPDTNVACARRSISTTAPQALMLLNSELTLSAAEALAARCVRESNGETTGQVQLAWRYTLGREPSPTEQSAAAAFLTGQPNADSTAPSRTVTHDGTAALIDLCLSLFNLNEFIYID